MERVPSKQQERVESEDIPWLWVERAIVGRLEKVREEIINVQMRVDFHPSWIMVWEAVNEALGDIREMRRLGHQIHAGPVEQKCPLRWPKYAHHVESGSPVRREPERTVAGQRESIAEFAEAILDLLRECGPKTASQVARRVSRKPLWKALAESAGE